MLSGSMWHKAVCRIIEKGINMPGKNALLGLSISMLVLTGNIVADDGDRAAILALMDKAFHAVGSGDPDDMRSIQLAEGTSISFRQQPDGEPGELLMRMTTNEALLADTTEDKLVEQWTSEPTVMIRGPIAVVWGEYEFLINGRFSHCGVDSIDLVNVDGDWKIANWMWTVEKKGCPTAPSAVIE
jgi:hypothetical protein